MITLMSPMQKKHLDINFTKQGTEVSFRGGVGNAWLTKLTTHIRIFHRPELKKF